MTVGLLSLGAPGGLQINLMFDSTWPGAPAGYTAAVQTAASVFTAACPHTNITVNIVIALMSGTSAVGANNGGVLFSVLGTSYTYSAIKTAMAAIALPSSTLSAFAASLPSGTSLNGVTNFALNTCSAKAFGFIPPNDPIFVPGTGNIYDGSATFGDAVGVSNMVGVAIHELGHVLCRDLQSQAPMVFSRLNGVNSWNFGASGSNNYFSLDNGTTKLADYATNASDPADFNQGGVQDSVPNGGPTNDCFDNFYPNRNAISAIDLKLVQSCGLQ